MPSTLAAQTAAAFRGERTTDAGDAAVIANTIRVRPGLRRITATHAVQAQLQLLTARRADLVHERVRTTWRLQLLLLLLTSVSPAIERALDVTLHGPVHILMQWQTPAMIRRTGVAQIEAMLRSHKVNNAATLAHTVIAAARRQRASVPGETTAAMILAQMATDLHALNQRIDAAGQLLATALAELTCPQPSVGNGHQPALDDTAHGGSSSVEKPMDQ